MTVYTVVDIERATSKLVIRPTDLVTPLARDRAAERGIPIEVDDGEPETAASPVPDASPARGASGGLLAPASPVAAPRPPGGLLQPPSGAMYRRGAPLHAGIAAPRVGGQPARTEPRSGKITAAVVGAGHVGAMTALRLAESDLFDRITLVDVIPGLAAGLALDIWHGASLRDFATRVDGTDDMAGVTDASYVVVTAGRPRTPGMSRTDLTSVNSEIVTSVAEGIRRHAPHACVIVVTNPLEEMTHITQRVTGFPPERVVGMAGVLDSSRFCSLVGLVGGARPADVSVFAFGSHGPEMVIPLSQASVGTTPIERVLDAATLAAIVERTRDSGAEVVSLLQKGSAYFAPAEAAAAMVRAMVTDADDVMTACVQSRGAYGLVDTRVGLPVRLGPSGVKEIVSMPLRADEQDALCEAAMRIDARIRELG